MLILLCFQVNAANLTPRLFVRPITYKGTSQISVQEISQIIKERIIASCAPVITDAENKADYAISVSFDGKPGEYALYLEANGIIIQNIKESVLKRTATEAGIPLIIQEAVDYLMIRILPVQTFYTANESFLAETKISTVFGDEFIDRDRKNVRQTSNMFVTPIMDNIFKRYPFQIQFFGGATIPVGLGDASVPVSFNLSLPVDYYFYTIQLFAFSVYAQLNYNLIYKKVASDKTNNLNVIGIDGGLSAAFTLPFAREIMLHLKIGFGYTSSFFASTLNPGTIYNSNDPCFHPSFEIEYALNDYLSLSGWCSYMWIWYLRDNVHAVQTGVSLGFRF